VPVDSFRDRRAFFVALTSNGIILHVFPNFRDAKRERNAISVATMNQAASISAIPSRRRDKCRRVLLFWTISGYKRVRVRNGIR